MRIRPFAAALIGFLVSGCAATTPAPRLSPMDPADPKASEAAIPIPSTLLQLPASQPTTPSPPTEAMTHEHHTQGSPDDKAPVADVYSCPTHPQVRKDKHGKCPICGMALVKQPFQPTSEPKP